MDGFLIGGKVKPLENGVEILICSLKLIDKFLNPIGLLKFNGLWVFGIEYPYLMTRLTRIAFTLIEFNE